MMAGLITTCLYADPVDLQQAKAIAAGFMANGQQPTLVNSNALTRNGKSENAPLYIFNRGDNQGFVIVSGDNCMPEILGYTESGNFDVTLLPPALIDWLDGYSQMIRAAQAVNAPARVITRATNTKQSIEPLVTAHWSQGAPYNNLCPFIKGTSNRALTGCVATAAAQVVYYWRKENPRRTGYTTPTYGYGDAPVTDTIAKGTPLQWELMQDNYNGSTPEDMNTAVATLMSVIGTSTWLTYGSSTSGQISNLVNTFSGQFQMDSKCTYKSGISQENWENMIYSDLSQGWPIVYSGVHPTSGGHAVVVDGYNATNNLFHFNFGWGGQGDGYYTVNDTNGMNGFSGQQGMTHTIRPRVFKLDAEILTTEIFARMKNTVRISLTNNGTTDYSGVYLFFQRNATLPTNIGSANAKDITTVVPSGETMQMELTYRPSLNVPYYLCLLDKNGNLLDSVYVNTREQVPDLTLRSLNVNTNGETGTENITSNGQSRDISYVNVYQNGGITAMADIENAETGTMTIPTIECTVSKYDSGNQTFEEVTKRSVNDIQFSNGEMKQVEFDFTGLEQGALYALALNREYSAGAKFTMNADCDTVVFFKLSDADLVVNKTDDYTVKVTGHWNENEFNNMATDPDVACYDLTEVVGQIKDLKAANPNALFYVTDNHNVAGTNVICNNKCQSLKLQSGYNFCPQADFTAEQAQFEMDADNQLWHYIVLPFDCNVPQGDMARKIYEINGLLISKMDSVNTKLEAGTPYLYKTSHLNQNLITAENVLVSTQKHPDDCADEIKSTFVNLVSAANQRMLNQASSQVFEGNAGQIIPAFSGYLECANNVNTTFFSYTAKDNVSNDLIELLIEANNLKNEWEESLSEQDYNSFMEQLNRSAECYTNQPQKSDIEASCSQLEESINQLMKARNYNGTPLDMTDIYITNPSFESRTSGWDIQRKTGQTTAVQDVTNLNYYVSPADGKMVFYSYSNTNAGSVTISQDLNGLRSGYYQLKAMIALDEDESVVLFANDHTTTVTGDDFGKRYMQEAMIDSIKVEDGSLTIGIEGNESWYKADHFQLYYIGDGSTDGVNMITDDKQNDLKVWSQSGTLFIQGSGKANIYHISGQMVASFTVEGLKSYDGLKKGIYIVNGEKVIIR